MEIKERIVNLENHLKSHPTDYQSRIALLKMRSDEIENRARLRQIERLKKVSECRRLLHEE